MVKNTSITTYVFQGIRSTRPGRQAGRYNCARRKHLGFHLGFKGGVRVELGGVRVVVAKTNTGAGTKPH